MPGIATTKVAGDDAVVLKPIAELDLSRFDKLLKEVRKHARRAGLRKADIAQAIRTARARE